MTLITAPSNPQKQESRAASGLASATPHGCDGLLALVAAGLLLRVALAVVSWGANDANLFGKFGFEITRDGLMATYRVDPLLNHPPIPSYWCAVAWRLSVPFYTDGDRLFCDDVTSNTPGPWFSAVFKIPVLLAECATVWLLYRLWKQRQGTRRGLAVAAMYAWSVDAMLVSGYHCNTDPIYAFLCLLSVYLAQDRRCHFWAGAALAAAINVKLTPVLLVPPLLLAYRDWRQAGRFLAGVALGVIPFLPVFYFAGHSFFQNGIAYKSNLDRWGIPYLLMLHGSGADAYYIHGRPLVLVLVGLWAVAARLSGQTDRYEVAAVTLGIFLFFASGFGVQYTVMVLPLMFAARPRLANIYGLLAGLFLLVVYWGHWTGRWPPDSQFHGYFPWPSPLWGLAAWGTLGLYLLLAVVRLAAIRRPRGSGGGETDFCNSK